VAFQAPASRVADVFVAHDSGQPSPQVGAWPKGFLKSQRKEHGVLNQIIRFIGVAGIPSRELAHGNDFFSDSVGQASDRSSSSSCFGICHHACYLKQGRCQDLPQGSVSVMMSSKLSMVKVKSAKGIPRTPK
jgi:hypothetical protein